MNSQFKSKYDMRNLSAKLILFLTFWVAWSGAANADFAISVDKIGAGIGTVVATSDGNTFSGTINCGTSCAASFPQVVDNGIPRLVNVSFTATPNAGSVFKGWFKADGITSWPVCGTRISCSVSATQLDQQITAKFEPAVVSVSSVPLTVINAGSGSDYGKVVSTPAIPAIDCRGSKFDTGGSTVCSQNFAPGSSVTLNASVGATSVGSYFNGWQVFFNGDNGPTKGLQSDLCVGLVPSCNITVPPTVADIQVRAIFNLGFVLNIISQGQGSGILRSSSNNLQSTCSGSATDAACLQTYDPNRVVTITAIPDSNSTISGWIVDGVVDPTNCKDKSSTCIVTMDKAHTVIAKFEKIVSGSFTAQIIKEGSGTGFGTVTGGVANKINCGVICSSTINPLTESVLSFQAKPDRAGVVFAGWKVQFKRYLPDGTYVWDPYDTLCTGLQPICEVTISSDIRVWAKFDYDIILTVVKDGSGLGSISTNSSTLNECAKQGGASNICYQTFVGGQVFSLTAIPDVKSRFVKWNGCEATQDTNNDGVQEVCSVTMDQAKRVTATFEVINSAQLSVTKDPASTGEGTVKSDLLGLNCGTICNRNYAFTSIVTLTATPLPGSEFVGWGGDWCSGLEPTCKVTMDQAKDVIARFDSGYRLTVSRQGEGDGAIFSQPAGINCGTNCAASFPNNTNVVLTAKSVNGSTFLGWGGECTGNQLTCSVSMTQARNVAATFSGVGIGKALDNTDLSWTVVGDAPWFGQLQKDAKVKTTYFAGSAGVSGAITHGQYSTVKTTVTGPRELSFYWKVSSELNRDFMRFYVDNNEINVISGEVDWTQVKYTIAEGTHDLVWTYSKDSDISSGADSAWLDQVQMSIITGATRNSLTLTVDGNGQGYVTSNPAGISCSSNCSKEFSNVTQVILTAVPTGTANFIGWGGDCSGNKLTCVVSVSGSKSATAFFSTPGDFKALRLGLLNDTGIDWCANKTSNFNKSDNCGALISSFPGQDAMVGRDFAAVKSNLVKMGNGEAGFDYSKICNNGEVEGDPSCPRGQTTPGAEANQWACTRDNVTGLIWEVKTTGGLRDKDVSYSWYNTNDRLNGGSKGDNCTAATCNTDAFVKAINQQGLCGANDWRLPSRKELHSLAHQGRSSPAIDISYFPNTVSNAYWTGASVAASANNAWYVNFETGWDYWDNKSNKQRVRLVRTCDDCVLATTANNPIFKDARLRLPLVKVVGDYYDASLRLVNSSPLVFELSNAAPKKSPIVRSANSTQAEFSLNGLLTLGNVEVGGEHYNATLQLIPGSNPLRFQLKDAYVVH